MSALVIPRIIDAYAKVDKKYYLYIVIIVFFVKKLNSFCLFTLIR